MSDDPFTNVPLFQELQRLLTSSTGPVNWELARQVAIASATAEKGDQEAIGDMVETVRIAELQIHEFAGIEPPSSMPDVRMIRRSSWVTDAVERLPSLVDPAATRVAEGFTRLQGSDRDEDALATGAPAGIFGATDMHQAMGAVMVLMQGVQTGTVIGAMGASAFASYDLAIPRSDHVLSFVEPSISAFEESWSLPSDEFRLWVAIREVALRHALAQPWALAHLTGLVGDAANTMEVDLSELQGRLEHLDAISDPRAMQELVQGGDSLFEPVMDEEQRLKVARVRAFMAAAEGFGAYLTRSIAGRILGASSQIQEAVQRVDRGASQMFPRLLGIELTPDQLDLGRRFCGEVAEQTSPETLSLMWADAEALPSWPELEEPRLWMARIA